MAFFRWLFGIGKSVSDKSLTAADRWVVSKNGNSMLVDESTRITVFQQDQGWKYCIADVDDREDSCFSDVYSSEREAQEEALAHFRGNPSRHQSLPASFVEDRQQRWEAHIRERSHMIDDLQRFLAENTDLGITVLRKPESKIASHLKQLDWQIAEYRSAGISADLVSLAEQQKLALAKLAKEVVARIEAKQAKRPPRKRPVSDSQLSTKLARKIDDLIRLFVNTPIMNPSKVARRYRRTIRDAVAKMIDEGITYGQASGAPDFLNQNEESFRAFMKQADQDIGWQCDTVSDAFKRYLETGEIPAPHYPMRIAVLLRKAKDFDREKQFLATWCKHFPSGNGVTYAALVERAKKAGAVSV